MIPLLNFFFCFSLVKFGLVGLLGGVGILNVGELVAFATAPTLIFLDSLLISSLLACFNSLFSSVSSLLNSLLESLAALDFETVSFLLKNESFCSRDLEI